MPTKKKRHVCTTCKRKLVESKMYVKYDFYRSYSYQMSKFWECLECKEKVSKNTR